MIVKALELERFRNYVRFQTEFHPRVNLIYGENAQGKTNLLEAIATSPPPGPTGPGMTGR